MQQRNTDAVRAEELVRLQDRLMRRFLLQHRHACGGDDERTS